MADRQWSQSLIVAQVEVSSENPWVRITVEDGQDVDRSSDKLGYIESVAVLLADTTQRVSLFLHPGREPDPFAYVNGLSAGDRLEMPEGLRWLWSEKQQLLDGSAGGFQGSGTYWYFRHYDSPAAGTHDGDARQIPRGTLDHASRNHEMWIRFAGINEADRPSLQVRGWKFELTAYPELFEQSLNAFGPE